MTDPIVCPRCGLEQSQAADCINCGVVFAKVGREPSARPLGTAAVASQSRGSLIGGLLLAALAIAAALLFFPRSPSPAPPAASAPPEVDEPAPARGGEPLSEAPAAVEAAVVDEPASPEPLPKERRPARFPTTWYEGAAGYEKAMREAREDGTPVAVYFYTDWCGYCRQLDEELLSQPRVQEPFRYLVKVKINPEKGHAERSLADEYEVGGYPSFFILPSADGQAKRVSGQVQDGDGWRLRTPEDFVAVCYKAARI